MNLPKPAIWIISKLTGDPAHQIIDEYRWWKMMADAHLKFLDEGNGPKTIEFIIAYLNGYCKNGRAGRWKDTRTNIPNPSRIATAVINSAMIKLAESAKNMAVSARVAANSFQQLSKSIQNYFDK